MYTKTRLVPAALSLVVILAMLPASIALARSPVVLEDQNLFSSMTHNYHAHLDGVANVPVIETTAQGEAVFRFDPDTNTMYFKILAANIEDVFASHIHCAPEGANGPAGVTLLFLSQPIAQPNGVVVEGTISQPDPGNLCGWTTLSDVENAIRSGNAYVNLHTTTYRSGEIRGQIY